MGGRVSWQRRRRSVETAELVAPSLWRLEAANALWLLAKRGEITVAQAAERLALLDGAPITTVPLETDLSTALEIAGRLGHPVYDCLYLALAVREDTFVITADARFLGAAGRVPALQPRVRLLGAQSPV